MRRCRPAAVAWLAWEPRSRRGSGYHGPPALTADPGPDGVDARPVDAGPHRGPRRRLPSRRPHGPPPGGGLVGGAADLVLRPRPRVPGHRHHVLGRRLPARPVLRPGHPDGAAGPGRPAVPGPGPPGHAGHRGVPARGRRASRRSSAPASPGSSPSPRSPRSRWSPCRS